jgi:hypothetical protein
LAQLVGVLPDGQVPHRRQLADVEHWRMTKPFAARHGVSVAAACGNGNWVCLTNCRKPIQSACNTLRWSKHRKRQRLKRLGR